VCMFWGCERGRCMVGRKEEMKGMEGKGLGVFIASQDEKRRRVVWFWSTNSYVPSRRKGIVTSVLFFLTSVLQFLAFYLHYFLLSLVVHSQLASLSTANH
jgi:hypothetical protein